MRPRVFAWIVLTVLSATPCLKGQESFFVLEVERQAHYDIDTGTALGLRRGEAIERIDGKQDIKGKTYFKTVLVFSGIPGREPSIWYQRVAPEGRYELRFENGQPVEQLDIPFPVEIGRKWVSKFNNVESTCRVEARESAILPQETYEGAFKVACSWKIRRVKYDSYAYYVAGIGLVKLVERNSNGRVSEFRLRDIGKGDM